MPMHSRADLSILDDPERMRALDPGDMLGRIGETAAQIRAAWTEARRLELPQAYRDARNIVILGMGGSAIGGELLRTLTYSEARVPIVICREYDLPGFVGPDSLAIGVSYSGNTEETLSAFEQARQRGCRLLAITSGGRLAELAEQYGVPLYRFSYKAQPRAAMGYLFVPLLAVAERLGIVGSQEEGVQEAIQTVEQLSQELAADVPAARNMAKQLAGRLHGRLPVIYGAGILSEVARRWKGQFNENSKSYAAYDVFPELNHNAVVGYQNPADLAEALFVVLLVSSHYHPRTLRRIEVTQELLQRRGIPFERVTARGRSATAQLFTSIVAGDYTSYYLAILYATDPSPVEPIDYLKQRLAQLGEPFGEH
jgi:glucose/mannose-6-phosphate isomerase